MDVQVTSRKGRIEIITGCMFSGKTQELIERAKRAKIAGHNVVGFKPDIDNRYEENAISSHDGVYIDAVTVDSGSNCSDEIIDYIKKNKDDTDVVVIDELNLFDASVIDCVNYMASQEIRVIMSGLDQDFRGEPFDPVPDLMAISDNVEKRKAVCECCGSPATKTQRLIDGDPAPYNSPTIEVGSDEKYEPRCRSCHIVK